jgi:hypothetical protein
MRLKHNIKNAIRRMQKKLSALGDLNFRIVSQDVQESDVQAFQTVYGCSWKPQELDASFYPALMNAMARSGRLRLGILLVNDRAISTQLWFYANGRGYVVKTAYDEAMQQFSPGTLLTWFMIKYLIDHEDMRFFDFLRGDDSYKKYWTTHRRERLEIEAFHKSRRGGALFALEQKILPRVRANRYLNSAKKHVARFIGT